jgi:RHH-type proline utilization regulon transcriptional repressor/proline dehydrogenase/delta 1-pyrroline-5-carboxylate dehydrogenase
MRKRDYKASSILGNHEFTGESIKRLSPHELKKEIGSVTYLKTKEIKHVFEDFDNSDWSKTSLKKRIEILSKVGELLSNNRAMLFHLLINEAGKTLKDCDAELREAIDFINYYNAQAKKIFKRKRMPGPSGEENYLEHAPKGTFLCISPWNFPLAIFVGQITAALVTGNNVIAKPAEDTSIIGCEVVKIFHESGVPKSALKLVLGDKKIGNELTKNPLIAGVAFTGSSFAAKQINKNLADSNGPIKSLIAETGGQNAMIVDSSSLKEQVIDDVIRSAFLSAGQRCSALRVLYVQDEIADEYWDYLNEALQEYTIGDPNLPKVDIGPIINKNSKDRLLKHISALKKSAKRTIEHHHKQDKGNLFITPIVFEIDSINQIDEENFGPILHFIRYKNENLEQVIDEINDTGYGLTMGVHSRIVSKARRIFEAANVGNFYFNRDIVGAVVGVQPFGGQGLSGTGPKAGGPGYLYNFVTEKTYTDNVMATGGNIELLNKNAM